MGTLNCLNWVGGGTEREVKWEDCQGGRGQGEKGKGKWSIVFETYVVRKRMKKTPAVQNGHALPMGRRASPSMG